MFIDFCYLNFLFLFLSFSSNAAFISLQFHLSQYSTQIKHFYVRFYFYASFSVCKKTMRKGERERSEKIFRGFRFGMQLAIEASSSYFIQIRKHLEIFNLLSFLHIFSPSSLSWIILFLPAVCIKQGKLFKICVHAVSLCRFEKYDNSSWMTHTICININMLCDWV
jgi:hypothetical protein